MHLAWSNSSPSSAFGAQNIPLDISACPDYDFVEWTMAFSITETNATITFKQYKGKDAYCSYGSASGQGSVSVQRRINYTSDTSYSVSNGAIARGASSAESTGNYLVPLYAKIGKDDLTAKIKAIAHDVSTDASKCMLDEQHSVEQALTTPYIIDEATVTSDTTIGSINLKIYSNGIKQVRIANANVTTSGYTSGYIIPEAFRPKVSTTVFGVSWGGGNIRPFALNSDGRVSIYASTNAGLDITAIYM